MTLFRILLLLYVQGYHVRAVTALTQSKQQHQTILKFIQRAAHASEKWTADIFADPHKFSLFYLK